MNKRFGTSRARLLGVAALMVLVSLASFGCEKSPEERLRMAKAAVINDAPDKARENLEPVLEAEPDNFEARLLMARTLQLEEDFEKSDEKFKELWKEEGFDDEDKDLSSAEQTRKKDVRDDMVDMYIAWAESIDQEEDPDTFEEVAKKGLEHEPEKPDLNDMLLDFYNERGEAALDEDDKEKAAEYFEGVLDLQGVLPADHKKAREQAQKLRFEFNKKELDKYFEEKGRARLEKDDRYDADEETISFTVEQSISELEEEANKQAKKAAEEEDEEFEEIEFDLQKEKDVVAVQRYMVTRIVPEKLSDILVDAVGVDKDSAFGSLVPTPKGVETGGWEFESDSLSVTAKLDKKTLLRLGSDVKEDTRRAREKEKEEGGEDKSDKDDKGDKDKEARAKADKEEQKEDKE